MTDLTPPRPLDQYFCVDLRQNRHRSVHASLVLIDRRPAEVESRQSELFGVSALGVHLGAVPGIVARSRLPRKRDTVFVVKIS